MYEFKLVDPHFLPHSGIDINLSLGKGEVLVLTGPNGIGKSTLLSRLFKFYDSVSYVEQGDLDFFYNRELKKIKEIFNSSQSEIPFEELNELWDLFYLNEKLGRLQSSLSGGEGQLLKLSLGLAPQSEIYFLDEPSQYLDDQMKEKLSGIISKKVNEGRSFFIVEHDLKWMRCPFLTREMFLDGGVLKIKGVR